MERAGDKHVPLDAKVDTLRFYTEQGTQLFVAWETMVFRSDDGIFNVCDRFSARFSFIENVSYSESIGPLRCYYSYSLL
jgi:hypothetical protein